MLSKEELGDYLKSLRLKRGYSLRYIDSISDLTYTNLSMVEHGKRNVTPALLRNLATLYNVDYIDLYEKAGYVDLIEDEMKKKIHIDEFGNEVVSIPLVGTVKAGYDFLAQENWEDTKQVKKDLVKSGDFFALRIKGNSMKENLWDGDIVAVQKQNFADDGDMAVVLINGDEATVKVFKITENGIKLMPLNRSLDPETQEPLYEDLYFTKKEIELKPVQIIGIVKALIERKF